MGLLISKRIKRKGSNDILLSLFFIIIVLIVLSLFTNFHKFILINNYNFNKNELTMNNAFSLKKLLVECYGYPLKITSINNCKGLSSMNFQVKIISNGVCNEKTVLSNGKIFHNYASIMVPVINENSKVCIGEIKLYAKK